MKVTGTGPAAPPGVEDAAAATATRPPEAAGATGGAAFAEQLRGPSAVTATSAPEAPRGTASTVGVEGVPGVTDIGADLEAGRIDAARAMELVIGRVIDSQLGANAAPAARARLEQVLRETLQEDPMLAARMQRLRQAG